MLTLLFSHLYTLTFYRMRRGVSQTWFKQMVFGQIFDYHHCNRRMRNTVSRNTKTRCNNECNMFASVSLEYNSNLVNYVPFFDT